MDREGLDSDYWLEALERFQALASSQTATINFDLKRLERALYDPPIYQHVEAILVEERRSELEGRRYAPRLMMALLMMLHDRARSDD